MKPHNEELKLAGAQGQAKKTRFRIEKLEERIAPKKGGIPGPPDQNPGNKPICWGDSCCKPKFGCSL